mgnify:CR=1 FL=1
MKKILFTLLLLLTCQLAFCQTANDVFNEYRDKKHAEYVSVPKLLMTIAAGKVKDGNTAALLNEVDEAKVLTLSDCSSGVRKKFAKKIVALSDDGYSEFTGVKKGKSEGMNILVKQKGDTITEVVALSASDNTCVGILITGDIKAEDVAAIIGMVDN